MYAKLIYHYLGNVLYDICQIWLPILWMVLMVRKKTTLFSFLVDNALGNRSTPKFLPSIQTFSHETDENICISC